MTFPFVPLPITVLIFLHDMEHLFPHFPPFPPIFPCHGYIVGTFVGTVPATGAGYF